MLCFHLWFSLFALKLESFPREQWSLKQVQTKFSPDTKQTSTTYTLADWCVRAMMTSRWHGSATSPAQCKWAFISEWQDKTGVLRQGDTSSSVPAESLHRWTGGDAFQLKASAWTPALFWWVRAVTWRTGVQMLCTLWLHLTVTAWKQLWTAQLITTQTCVMCVYRAKRFHRASFGGTLETDQSKPLIGVIVSKCVLVFQLFLGLMGTAFSSPVCPQNCNHAQHYHRQYFTHVSDLHNSSVAPWKLQWVYLLKARKEQKFRLHWSYKHSCIYTTGASGV